jgi:hypothetical protein
MIGTQTTSTGARPGAIVGLLAVVVASVAIGAIGATAMKSGRPAGDLGVVVPPSVQPSPTATPLPSTKPSVAPTSAPSQPGASEEPRQSDEPGRDAIPLTVDLVNETNDEVYVDIADNSGLLVDARSGIPAGGVSVDSYVLKVENVDARTLRLTWSDYAIPNALALYIGESARRFILVQPEPRGDVDAMAHDRVLILTFSKPISADDIEAILQDGLDT